MSTYKIMACNIWGDYFGNKVEPRVQTFIDYFKKESPDVLGIQEYTPNWYKSPLFSELSDEYASIGCFAERNNYTPLLFKKEKFSVIEGGWMLYTETPDKSKGISWAVLEDNVSGKRRMFCCTHFWWKTGPEHDVIRLKNADELAALVKTITAKYDAPAFIFGDLNTHYDDSPFKRLVKHGFEYLMETAEDADKMSSWHGDPVKVSEDKYVGSKTQNDFRRSLDHIFSFNNKEKVKEYRICEEQALLDVSDHSPIHAIIEEE